MAENPVPDDPGREIVLVELLNRVLDRGVVITGEITISVAEVDLLFVGLRLLLTSVDTIGGSRPTRLPLEAAVRQR